MPFIGPLHGAAFLAPFPAFGNLISHVRAPYDQETEAWSSIRTDLEALSRIAILHQDDSSVAPTAGVLLTPWKSGGMEHGHRRRSYQPYTTVGNTLC